MKKNFLRKMFCSLVLAATVLTANAADRLLIVGEAVWGGWSIDNSIVMLNSTENPDVFKATVNLNANGTFKFLTTTGFGNLEYRAGNNDVALAEGVASPLVSSEENSNDKQFKVSETANYDIVCDLTAKTIVVKKSHQQYANDADNGIFEIYRTPHTKNVSLYTRQNFHKLINLAAKIQNSLYYSFLIINYFVSLHHKINY